MSSEYTILRVRVTAKDADTLRALLRDSRPDLGYSDQLQRVFTKGLQRNPDDRYQTAPEFADAFANAVAGRSETNGPDSDGPEGTLLDKLFGR